MGKHRALLRRRQPGRLIEDQRMARTSYVLYETAWADAWPHLENWFKRRFWANAAGIDLSLFTTTLRTTSAGSGPCEPEA